MKCVIVTGVQNDSFQWYELPKCVKGRVDSICLLLDEQGLNEMGKVHHRTVFIDDRMHDWDLSYDGTQFRYYAHSSEKGDVVDIVIFYE